MIQHTFSELIHELKIRISYRTSLAESIPVNTALLSLYKETEKIINNLDKLVVERNFRTNYAKKLYKDLEDLKYLFGTMPNEGAKWTHGPEEHEVFKQQYEKDDLPLGQLLARLNFSIDFFSKVDFLNTNLVVVGSNGSGKTLLANHLKIHMNQNAIIISAQKKLSLPARMNMKSLKDSQQELKEMQELSRTYKDDNTSLEHEFVILIQNLISENASAKNTYSSTNTDLFNNNKSLLPPPPSKLEKALAIWNSIYQYRQLTCHDGINLEVRAYGENPYEIMKLSEGEKVTLFLIAHTLLAPVSGFIIVDEPEMHLHPLIHKKVWNALERERQDCIFIYFTHDLTFASSRTIAKKLWLKSYNHNRSETFKLIDIAAMEIPEDLLLEILGSRQTILFCEGSKNSVDYKLYSVLFPNFNVKAVGGCSEVMNLTKAFNKIEDRLVHAVGLIDADFLEQERSTKLRASKIYSIRLSEVENLLMDEEFLITIALKRSLSKNVIKEIKEKVLALLSVETEKQVSNYVTSKIVQYFIESHPEEADTISLVEENLSRFISKIDVKKIANDRRMVLAEIDEKQNYSEAIRVMNSKNLLLQIANQHLKTRSFLEISLQEIQLREEVRKMFYKHFPQELLAYHTSISDQH